MKKIIGVSFIVIVLDRIIKILVQSYLTTTKLYIIKNFFYLVFAKNIGAAFSILEGSQIILILIGILALAFIFYHMIKNNKYDIGYAFLCGGIVGNIIDRIVYNYVIDYIGLEFFGFSFPIFNLADACIVLGAFIVLFLGSDKSENNS